MVWGVRCGCVWCGSLKTSVIAAHIGVTFFAHFPREKRSLEHLRSMMSAFRSLSPSTMVSCVFASRSCFKHFSRLQGLLDLYKRCSLKSQKVLETATRSTKHETIEEGQRLRKADIMDSKCSGLRFFFSDKCAKRVTPTCTSTCICIP